MMKFALLVLAALSLAACGSGEPTASSPTPSAQARPSSTGTIRVLEPGPGEIVDGPDVVVKVELTGARLVAKNVAEVTPDTGHMHISLDGKTLTLLAGETYTMKGVSPGLHILSVELAAGDHGPFYPRVQQQVTFRVR